MIVIEIDVQKGESRAHTAIAFLYTVELVLNVPYTMPPYLLSTDNVRLYRQTRRPLAPVLDYMYDLLSVTYMYVSAEIDVQKGGSRAHTAIAFLSQSN